MSAVIPYLLLKVSLLFYLNFIFRVLFFYFKATLCLSRSKNPFSFNEYIFCSEVFGCEQKKKKKKSVAL